jgi:prepilin-type processing-associated H-X9-DG protein
VGGFSNEDNSNMKVLDSLSVAPYRCPSSTVPQWANVSQIVDDSQGKYLGATYVGISGAAFRNGGINPNAASVDSEAVMLGTAEIQLSNGTIHGANGLLIQNECISMHQIVDGSSNTILVGEQSSAVVRIAGSKTTEDPIYVLSSFPGSAWPGTGLKGPINPGVPIGKSHTLSNVTTIRYPINLNNTADSGSLAGLGLVAGNKPITSAHFGVANVLFADGSVRTVAETIDFATLMSLADREDRNIIKGF